MRKLIASPLHRLLKTLAVLGLAAVLQQPAAAATRERAMFGTIGERLVEESFDGPNGFRALCDTNQELCAPPSAATDANLPWTVATRELLGRVQREVNRDIRPENEAPGEDRWIAFPTSGDCEDYALSKYMRLRQAGTPASNLSFGLTLTETGEYHAVLLVETDAGTMVLDNRFDKPMSWSALERIGYVWIAAQTSASPLVWRFTEEGIAFARRIAEQTPASQ